MTAPETVIGLEIHIQLNTATRLFSAEPVPSGGGRDRPNASSGPYALGHPGTYPVLNERAVRSAVRLGLALDCRINPESGFDRKHYVYPDLPRGYQITQAGTPVCSDGEYVPADRTEHARIRIRSIHLEEDAGRLVHRGDRTLVDYDRSGVPLLELVTEPDFRSAEHAAEFVRDLRDIVQTLGIGDGRMEDGSIRCDANISVVCADDPPGGPSGERVEIKNMNSFRHIEQALAFEAERQTAVVAGGGRVRPETRRFDADAGQTVPMRSKETAPDYRFIPEPDVPPIRISQAFIEAEAADLPERPDRLRRRLTQEAGLSKEWARIMAMDPEAARLLDAARSLFADGEAAEPSRLSALVRRAAAVLVEDVIADGHAPPAPAVLAGLARLVEDRIMDSASTGALLRAIHARTGDGAVVSGDDVERIAGEEGMLLSLAPDAADPFIQKAIREHPDEWRRYVGGKDGLLGFFVGRVLASADEPFDPAVVSEKIEKQKLAADDSNTDHVT